VNTSDMASRQTSVQDTVGTAERHHTVFEVLRIKAPIAVQERCRTPKVTKLRQQGFVNPDATLVEVAGMPQ
jgi:hypothetical protein